MTSWHSYPKIYNLGHAALAELLLDVVTVEEKIDGSQFSFGVFNGELRCRSKGQQLVVDAPEKLFQEAVETAKKLAPKLIDGWTYRAEYLKKPKHNVLAYDRTPRDHLIIFDVCVGEEDYLLYGMKAIEAERIGLEVVPLIYGGLISSADDVFTMMDRTSILGGQKIEGAVIKNYNRFGPDKKVLLGKHVSEAFKEVHSKNWRDTHPNSRDVLTVLCEQHRSVARWRKAVQHLKERGELTGTPRDIGKLLKETQVDVIAECAGDIKEILYKWAIPHITRASIRGLPEWYKEELVKAQFEPNTIPKEIQNE